MLAAYGSSGRSFGGTPLSRLLPEPLSRWVEVHGDAKLGGSHHLLTQRVKGFRLTDYEKGSAAWDIGMILTRHITGVGASRGQHPCARVSNLRVSAINSTNKAESRLKQALLAPCTCGAGDSDSEKTSILKEETNGSGTALPESSS